MRDPAYFEKWLDSVPLRERGLASISGTAADPAEAVNVPASKPASEADVQDEHTLELRRASPIRKRGIPLEFPLKTDPNLILFTPFIIPAFEMKPETIARRRDPFESLGRALSDHYNMVQHVPFSLQPGRGFTEVHFMFAKAATVIVILVCETASQTPEEDLAKQMDFADTVWDTIRTDSENGPTSKPFALLKCFPKDCNPPSRSTFPTIIRVPRYHEDICVELADTVFETSAFLDRSIKKGRKKSSSSKKDRSAAVGRSTSPEIRDFKLSDASLAEESGWKRE